MLELTIWKFWTPFRHKIKPLRSGREEELGTKATIVCETHKKDASLLAAIFAWCMIKPAPLTIVADPGSFSFILELVSSLVSEVSIRDLQGPKSFKRQQLCMGFEEAQTDVVVICDDDSRWGSNVLISLVTSLWRVRGLAVSNGISAWIPLGKLCNLGASCAVASRW